MRVISWNINSVRLRIDQLVRLIKEHAPDMVLLQETKVENAGFPLGLLEGLGFAHQHCLGMKAYNGVAILSRLPFAQTGVRHWCGKEDCRHALVRLVNGLEVHSVYVPAGGDVPDPEENPKFAHKLQFLDEMADWWLRERSQDQPILLAGDLNIAPLEQDVWSHRQMMDVVSHTPVEVERLDALRRTLNWLDVARHYVPPDQKLYTWWSYRSKDWQSSDRGRRLDHIWVTRPLEDALRGFSILRDVRGWEPRPSDHVPLVLDLAL